MSVALPVFVPDAGASSARKKTKEIVCDVCGQIKKVAATNRLDCCNDCRKNGGAGGLPGEKEKNKLNAWIRKYCKRRFKGPPKRQ